MTLPVFTPPVSPTAGMQDKPELKILKTEFGDGYSQPTPNGINHIRRVVTLEFGLLEPDEKDTIVDFLTAQSGTAPFLYTIPGSASPTRFTCDDWQTTALGASLFNVAATFRQDFGNAS
jgi:phage-related protein